MLVNVALVSPRRNRRPSSCRRRPSSPRASAASSIVREADGRFRPVDVVVGRDSGGDVEIKTGLREGETVVASGQFLLDSEASLKAALPRLDSRDARRRRPTVIARLIRWSIGNRLLVLLAALGLARVGVWAVLRAPLDALPDLSDVQVIVRVQYPGQAPQIIEDQVTYPLTTTMLSVPGAKVVRGFSFFGDAFVYVLFDDGTDPYWARTRVLEYLNQVQSRLPAGAKVSLGPDATGVGWIYEYALVDRTGKLDISELRALQDWFLKYELKTIPDVAEVASIGGMVRQFQVVVDPDKLVAFNMPLAQVATALQRSNSEAGGSVIELGEAEYMVRARGYLKSLDDIRSVVLRTSEAGVPVVAGRRRARPARSGNAARHRRTQRRRRSGRRRRGAALGQERAGGHPRGAGAAGRTEGEPARGGGDRHHLRPLAVDRARGGQPARQARRGIHRRRPRLPRVPAACALGAGRHHLAAAGRAGVVRRHALPGGERQHHVAGRHRHRHRRDGGRGDRDDRERAQAPGGRAAAGAGRPARRCTALGAGDRRGRRGRTRTVLLAAHHHVLIPAGVHAGSAGRPAVRAAGVHQDLRDGGRRRDWR